MKKFHTLFKEFKELVAMNYERIIKQRKANQDTNTRVIEAATNNTTTSPNSTMYGNGSSTYCSKKYK